MSTTDNSQQPASVCPCCGYCTTCGRRNEQPPIPRSVPYFVPVPPGVPYYVPTPHYVPTPWDHRGPLGPVTCATDSLTVRALS